MSTAVYWFRNDLRLADNPALVEAIARAEYFIPVYCHDPRNERQTRCGFPRVGEGRRVFLRDALDELRTAITERGGTLVELSGEPRFVLSDLTRELGDVRFVSEAVEAPEEQEDVAALKAAGIAVETVWQSSMIDPRALPVEIAALPDVFTAFRKIVEAAGLRATQPIAAPAMLPPLPNHMRETLRSNRPAFISAARAQCDGRSAFPYAQAGFRGGEQSAQVHVESYFMRKHVLTYKDTRNQMIGTAYSAKMSAWLANGCISARQLYARLLAFEAEYGANESTYWLWFELLWRDFFRFQHLKHGRALYRERKPVQTETAHDDAAFARWQAGATGDAFIDAAMRELAATGYLSNRMRQNVASYLVYDLQCDLRAGSAWFESSLIDYDVYSNHGNWLSIAGIGPNPRGPRRFNPAKQAQDYDASGAYRKLWAL